VEVTMERVNHNHRQRGYGARDKEELINQIISLHEKGIRSYQSLLQKGYRKVKVGFTGSYFMLEAVSKDI
jgi:hypothetical protein